MVSIIPIVGLLCLLGAASGQVHSVATLFSGKGCSGGFVSVTGDNYDLSQLGFDNRAYSVRLRGVWLFYDLFYYNELNSGNEHIFEGYEQCVDLKYIPGRASSIRVAGLSSDYRQDTITFYDLIYFQAAQQLIQHDAANLVFGGSIASILVTGSSDWTIYERPNYGGTAYCLRFTPTPGYNPAFLIDTTKMKIPVSHNFIRSVRKGCNAKSIIFMNRASENGAVQEGQSDV